MSELTNGCKLWNYEHIQQKASEQTFNEAVLEMRSDEKVNVPRKKKEASILGQIMTSRDFRIFCDETFFLKNSNWRRKSKLGIKFVQFR